MLATRPDLRFSPALRRFGVSVMLIAWLAAGSATLHAQAWTFDPAATPVIAQETPALANTAFAPLPNGGLLAYGDFTHVDGRPAAAMARFERNGTLDPALSAEFAANERPVAVVPLATGG